MTSLSAEIKNIRQKQNLHWGFNNKKIYKNIEIGIEPDIKQTLEDKQRPLLNPWDKILSMKTTLTKDRLKK